MFFSTVFADFLRLFLYFFNVSRETFQPCHLPNVSREKKKTTANRRRFLFTEIKYPICVLFKSFRGAGVLFQKHPALSYKGFFDI